VSRKIEDAMSRQVRWIDATASLKEAHELMSRHAIRHLLIQDKATGKLAGILSDRDVKKFVSPFAAASSASDRDKATLNVEVGKVMVKNIITAKAGEKVSSVVDTMMQKKISAVPIVDEDNRAIGIFTTTDAMKLLMTLL